MTNPRPGDTLGAHKDKKFHDVMNWPDPFRIDGRDYRPAGILHRTVLSENMRYACVGQPDYVLKISRFPGMLNWLLWPLLVYMSWREHRIHRRIEGIAGIPRQGPRHGWRGYSHAYVPGVTLETKPRGTRLPEHFFRELARIIHAVHARRVFYADLDRKANIIVGEDGKPWLIDFQASMAFRDPHTLLGKLTGPLFRHLQHEDIYHLLKHRHCYGDSLSETECLQLRRSRFGHWWRTYIRLPLRQVRSWAGLRRTRKLDSGQDAAIMPQSPQDVAH